MNTKISCLWGVGLLTCGLAGSGCESMTSHRVAGTDTRILAPTLANTESGKSPPGIGEILQASASESTLADSTARIELEEALRIAGVDNPTVNLALESAREAGAKVEAAEALKWPSLNAGFNFHIHRGNLQRSPGTILSVDSQSLYFGGGARSLAAETVAFPGIRALYPLTDVLIEPPAARQRLVTRTAESAGIRNATLLEVATAYLELSASEATVAELSRSDAELAEIVRLTEAFAKSGQGRDADHRRAISNRELLHGQLDEAIGEQRIASARLAGLLNLDPSTALTPASASVSALNLVDESAGLEALLTRAEATRPELTARTGEINEARLRVRQEQIRPWLPTLSAGYSIGGFGGGSNLVASEFGKFDSRSDFDISAVWSIQNLGFGNRANVNRTAAIEMQALANLEATRSRIREEVTAAYADIVAARARIESAKKRLEIAAEGYAEELKRVTQGQGLPLELLDSARSLSESRLEQVRAVITLNIAQFRLLTAIGSSPDATVGDQR